LFSNGRFSLKGKNLRFYTTGQLADKVSIRELNKKREDKPEH
jgi:hypothetical protein